MNKISHVLKISFLCVLGLTPLLAEAQSVLIQDNFTGTRAALDWAPFNGACLTAGDGSGKIPACVGLPYYSGVTLRGGDGGTLPDPVGKGALRFTNSTNYQQGAIVSKFTFPTGSGLAVTFSTVAYGGTGADGISFFLMDGSKAPGLGANGGSLAYSCNNATDKPPDGLIGAYLGLGMDEFGNFLNQGDNTSTGYGFQPNRIGMRGAGNTSWTWLNANYPAFYPSWLSLADQQTAVRATCSTGYVQNYSDPREPKGTSTTLSNYAVIPNAYKILDPIPLSVGSAATRGAATPITYQLRVTQDGLLSLAYSYNGGAFQPVLSNQSIVAANGPLPATFRFGFSGATGGQNNIHEIMCFAAGPADSAASSAGINTQQSGQVKTGTQIYLAYYHSTNWWGQLTSQNLLYDPATQNVTISSTANWDASCVLTGGTCVTTGATTTAEPASARTVLTWNGSAGIPFEWLSLTTAQQSALTAGDAAPVNSKRLDYLRGDRSNEITTGGVGLFRARTSVLGDIIDSSPVWVGPPKAPYPNLWTDALYPSASPAENTGAQKYDAFMATAATRLNVVYVGANDGMVHGFRAGAYDALGNFVANGTYPNDGKEVIAYMPAASVQTIHSTTTNVDYANAQYAHAFSADATAYAGDLYYQNAWHTWLVGGLGPGGKSLYALDITDPTTFSEVGAATIVKGDWTPASLNCAIVSACGNNMGNIYGTPQIRRFHNGTWGFVFGNGLGSSSGKAGIYVVTIDPATAVQTVYYLDTGTGSTVTPNGISFVTPADLDGDHTTDYVYAGDLLGNVWRFDLTSSTPSSWAVSKFGQTGPKPLFSTGGLPITTKVQVAITPAKTGAPRVIVMFGTGQQIPQTVSNPAIFASGSQSLFGVWDWDMAGWNGVAGPGAQKAALTGTHVFTASALHAQTIINQVATGGANGVSGYRTISSNKVCWSGSSDCTSGNSDFGWKLGLPTTQEQVIYSPVLADGAFIVNTTIPANNSPLACSNNLNTGWTMAISPDSGGAFKTSFFGDSANNFVSYLGNAVSAVQLGAVGSPSVVRANGSPYLVNQTAAGTGHVDKINPPGGTIGSRLTWQQVR